MLHTFCLALSLLLFQQPADPTGSLTLTSIEPSSVMDGTTVSVTFHGTGFVALRSAPEISAQGGAPFLSGGAAQWTDENTMTFLLRVQVTPGTYYVDIQDSATGARSNLLPLTVLSPSIRSTPQYDVTTFAGKPGGPGSTDGIGDAARFSSIGNPWGDGKYLYLPTNNTIRRLELSTGAVTTLTGIPGLANYFDGVATEARFNDPEAVWGDGENLYIADLGNESIRRLVPATGQSHRLRT